MSERSSTIEIASKLSAIAVLTLGSVSLSGDTGPVPGRIDKAVVSDPCDDQNRVVVDQFGHKVVVVSLDCVTSSDADTSSAVILSEARIPGAYVVERIEDGSILEGVCREMLPEATTKGESNEWVKIRSRNFSEIDGMPLIDSLGNDKAKYVNSAFVLGEKALPACDMQA